VTGDAFDDIPNLRIDPSDLALASKAKGNAKTRPKWRRRFVRVPWSWIGRLKTAKGATCRLTLLLIYEHWRNGGQAIRLTNVALAEVGVSRRAKGPALRELERVGLIQVTRRPRKSPLVTLAVDPRTAL
jgi:hypothetical protein